jgi:hypothetical protein
MDFFRFQGWFFLLLGSKENNSFPSEKSDFGVPALASLAVSKFQAEETSVLSGISISLFKRDRLSSYSRYPKGN